MDVVALLIPHAQAAESLLPTNRALDHPAVATQPHAALDSATREARRDTPLAQLLPQGPVVIRLVGVQLRGALPRAPTLATHRGTASTTSSILFPSGTFAPESVTESGSPRRSTI